MLQIFDRIGAHIEGGGGSLPQNSDNRLATYFRSTKFKNDGAGSSSEPAMRRASQFSGCGGGSSYTSPAPHGTQPGSYTITVTATASAAYGTVSHTTFLTLVVQ